MKTRNEIYQGEGAQLLRFQKQRVYQISDHKSGKTKTHYL